MNCIRKTLPVISPEKINEDFLHIIMNLACMSICINFIFVKIES